MGFLLNLSCLFWATRSITIHVSWGGSQIGDAALPLELRPGVTVPIPCRACGQGIMQFEIREGTHSVACPKCSVSTQVQVSPQGDRWSLKTAGETETTPPPQEATEATAAIDSPETAGKIGPLPKHDEEKDMAKQKLTPEKKAALRKELKAKLAAKVSRSEILKSLSTKFGISPEGIRWYLNAESPNGSSKKVKPPKKAKAVKAQSRKKKPAKKGFQATKAKKAHPSKPSSNGSALHLPELLGRLTEKALKGLLAAKRLVPVLEASRRREQELRSRVRGLSGELRVESSKARKLQRQIKKLAKV